MYMYMAVVLVLAWTTAHAQDNYDIRLSNISNSGKQGRVEILHDGQWGTVCYSKWDFFDALVACKQLGFRWVAGLGWQHNAGSGTGPVWLNDIRCKGSESRLDECDHTGWEDHQCGGGQNFNRAAGVSCLDEEEFKSISFYVTLVDGGANEGDRNEGRVMIDLRSDSGNRQFQICDQGWDLADANVICRMRYVGRRSAFRATTGSYFGNHDPEMLGAPRVSYLATDFDCLGNESHILQCPAKAWFQDDCPTGNSAGVICKSVKESGKFPIRLVGGSTPNEGRLEAFIDGIWGSTCEGRILALFSFRESDVICRQLGLGYGLETPEDERFGRSDNKSFRAFISCSGGESSLAECASLGSTDECTRPANYQPSVICSGPFPESRSPIMLSRPWDRPNSGNLYIHHDGRWGTVCSDGWTLANSKVVCRELGLPAPEQALTEYGSRGSGPIYLSGVSCNGDEETLDQCELGDWYQHDCTHSMDVDLTCDHHIRLSSVHWKQGRVEVKYGDQWGSLCYDHWDFYDALVACKNLGFPWLAKWGWRRDAGSGTLPIWPQNLRCRGSEKRLLDCRQILGDQCSDTSHVAAVSCSDEEDFKEQIFPVSLVDGSVSWRGNEGRVQVDLETGEMNRRFLICDQGWDLADANVICRMLNLPSAIRATTGSYFGNHDPEMPGAPRVSYLATDFDCLGNESHILQCPFKAWFRDDCPTGKSAGVVCNSVEESAELQLRLVGGSTPKEGRLEVFIDGIWGSICVERDTAFSFREGNVICQQLGFGYGLETPEDERFGRSAGSMAQHSATISCNGGESSFAQCIAPSQSPGEECFSKDGSYQASVMCSGPVPESRSPIKLTGLQAGHVLIHHDGRWGTICNASWTLANSKVVCRELGLPAPEQALTEYGSRGSGPIYLSRVSCNGDEETLDQCELGDWYRHYCTHSMDVHLACGASSPPDTGSVVTPFTGLLTSSVMATLWYLR